MKNKVLPFLLILFIVFELSVSFCQHYNVPLDGDMAEGVLREGGTSNIFQDPFGINSLLTDEKYPNPNRFFAHWFNSVYCLNAPIFLQNWLDPVDSVYFSLALIKTLIQAGFIFLFGWIIAWYAGQRFFFLGSALIAPFFQNIPYQGYMGIIDKAPTYFFFYALPVFFLSLFIVLFFCLPGTKGGLKGVLLSLTIVALAIILPFSGPLIPGLILIIFLSLWFGDIFPYSVPDIKPREDSRSFSKFQKLVVVLVILLALFSLFVGVKNSVNAEHSLSLLDRYSRLPAGLYYQFTQKLGWPLLLLAIIINIILLKRFKYDKSDKVINLLKWIGVLSLIYILLLPLGGYRIYRPYILRFDTVMPVTIAFVFYFGLTSTFLIKNMKSTTRNIYAVCVGVLILIFVVPDVNIKDENECERSALKEMSLTSQKIIQIDHDCTIMSWEKITDPKDSRLQARLINQWKITDEPVLYYHDPTYGPE